jgi:hypothetical protein
MAQSSSQNLEAFGSLGSLHIDPLLSISGHPHNVVNRIYEHFEWIIHMEGTLYSIHSQLETLFDCNYPIRILHHH